MYLVLLVVLLWTASSFLTRAILVDEDYNQPFIVTVINTSTFALYAPFHFYRSSPETEPLLGPRRWLNTRTLLFFVLYVGANWSSTAALSYIHVSTATMLTSTSGPFALLVGWIVGKEDLTISKWMATLCTGVGVWTLTQTYSFSWVGYGLALLSACLYACYSVLLQECVKDDQVTTFLGHVGLWNVVLLIPLLILQWEEFPTSGRVWLAVGVNALMGTFVAQYVWSLAVLRTSPVMVTLGLALSIPLALLGDMLLKGMPLSIEYVAGAALVVLGFLCIHYQS